MILPEPARSLWKRVAASLRAEIDDPAEDAARAVASRRYRSVTIEVDEGRLHAICTCGDGAERRRTHAITSSTELNDWLDRTGLGGYVDVAPDRNAREAVWKARTIATRDPDDAGD